MTTTTSVFSDLSNGMADAIETASGAIVAVNGRHRLPSTGIVWRSGLIVTAEHTVERDDDLSVTMSDGRVQEATLVGRDPTTDIAVLRVSGDTQAATIADTENLKVGHLVLAVGRSEDAGLSASFGVVSVATGEWSTHQGGVIDRFIRADVTLYPGFSGGPLLQADGQIVGVNTSGLTRGHGITIPTSTVNRVVDQLASTGRIARGYVGLGFQPVQLPEAMTQAAGITGPGGLIVINVEPKGPAEAAGVLIGDVVVTLNGKRIEDPGDVQGILSGDKIGQNIAVKVVRGGQANDLTIVVGERPHGGN